MPVPAGNELGVGTVLDDIVVKRRKGPSSPVTACWLEPWSPPRPSLPPAYGEAAAGSSSAAVKSHQVAAIFQMGVREGNGDVMMLGLLEELVYRS